MNRLRWTGPAATGFRPAWIVVLVSFLTCIAVSASAQHPGTPGAAPPPPPGDGSLTVQVVHATDPGEVAGIEIVLYALSPDGTPGLANGETDAGGRYQFSQISTDPRIVYLIGARYQEIPFGERVTFEAGATQARVEIEIMSPTRETAGIAIEEMRLRVDWMGDRVVVREILRVVNPGQRVIRIPKGGKADTAAIFTRNLDSRADDFSSGPNGVDDGIELANGAVRFRGPLYPGEQSVEFRYSLPVPSEDGSISLPIKLAPSAARLVVIAGTVGLQADGPALVASNPVQSDSGQSLEAWARAGLAAGEVFELALTLPESRRGRELLTIPRSDIWLEVDDTQLTATVDLQIEIGPGAPLAGTLESPLLRVSIPDGATLEGVAPEAESLGLIPIENGGFDVVGPIASGTTSLGYSYRMPVGRAGAQLGLRFPADVETLNVLIADTGLALDSSRLHRRRPFRSGTRNYLHREAFNISPDEVVDLELVPLQASGVPRTASMALTIAAAAVGAFFMFAPLRTAARSESFGPSPKATIAAKRKAVYTAIRDLDHDFETAKLEEADYTTMRDRLRAEAIELLRAEREAQQEGSAQISLAKASASSQPTSLDGSHPPTTGGFCPSCGGTVISSWRFCSHCGGSLNPPEEASG